MKFTNYLLSAALAFASLVSPLHVSAKQAAPAQSTTKAQPHASAKTGSTTAAPSPQDIADAKAKGMVWVNTSTHVYHKDGNFYGTTKHGKFMTEEDAQKAGYRAAKTGGGSKKAKGTSTAN